MLLLLFRGTADLMSHCGIPGRYRAAAASCWAGRTCFNDPTGGEGAGVPCCTVCSLDDLCAAATGLDTLDGRGRNAHQLRRCHVSTFRRNANCSTT